MMKFTGVTAGYGAGEVLRRVDLAVPNGSVVALLGPNGAGKTTMLRVASGLLRASSGSLTIDGVDVTGASADELVRHGVCHVPEGRGIFRSLTVRENILLSVKPSAARDAIELAVHAFPRLGERLGQTAGTMSGGEQQMLALSRAYVQKPRIVLLDEVSMGLSPLLVDEIFAFLERLAESGSSLLLVEQYVKRALELADYVYLLGRGHIVFAGDPSELDAHTLAQHYIGAGAAPDPEVPVAAKPLSKESR